jgi:futalosine hydrolase
MNILLTAATTGEIRPTLEMIGRRAFAPDQTTRSIDQLVTGIGLLSASHALTRHIYRHRPGLVIQAGIAGSFRPSMKGQVVVVKEDAVADLGVYEDSRFKTIFELGLVSRDEAPYHHGLLVNPYHNLLALSGLPQVRGISVNSITTDEETIDLHQHNFSPVVESMEGAALHYVCLMEKIPFLQIRAVSNDIGERDKTKWDMTGAILHLNEVLNHLLNHLEKKEDDTYFRV